MKMYTLLGGDITVTKKNENSRVISLEIPFYITTNMLPQFRHANSVMTRLDTYDTVTLPSTLRRTGVAAFFQENAFEHVHWMALFIEQHRHLINPDELFYEQGTARRITVVDAAREEKKGRLRNMRMYDTTLGIDRTAEPELIHQDYETAVRSVLHLPSSSRGVTLPDDPTPMPSPNSFCFTDSAGNTVSVVNTRKCCFLKRLKLIFSFYVSYVCYLFLPFNFCS